MIREQSRFTINPLYVVAIAMCCICSFATSLQTGLLFGLITAAIALLCVNLVSMVERIADKNLRAFLIAMLAGALIVVCDYVFSIIGQKFLLDNADNLKWIILAVIALSIVPTYFETRLSSEGYFKNLFFSIGMFLVLITVYSIIVEFTALGTIFNYQIFKGFYGVAFGKELFFQFFVIAILVIISNVIFNAIEDRKMRFNLLVERYKLQIKQTLIKKSKENAND